VDTAGTVRLVPPDSIATVRAQGTVRDAFQSYPALLIGDGDVPGALRRKGSGVDLEHRDARLALGVGRDGHVVIAMTRFEGLGGVLSNLPFGLTTPEMAALMGALGCRQAMLLDGGISSQLQLRGTDGSVHRWAGLRRVPLALLVLPALSSNSD
jgi:exopolysaccharide biosynthesis protein